MLRPTKGVRSGAAETGIVVSGIGSAATDTSARIAAANSVAVSNRSAGTFSSARAIAAAAAGLTLERTVVIGGGLSVTCRARTACALEATNGGSPASISYTMHASE